ncbi:hypothetical protein LXL04_029322 [Taraxacum kok-saghyz]
MYNFHDDDVASTSVKDMFMKLTPKKLTLKRTFVYVCDMDNIYRARRHTMIRLLKIKEMENPSNDNGKSQFTTKTPGNCVFTKIKLPRNCTISFPNGNEDIMNFDVTITPEDGFYMYHTRNTKIFLYFLYALKYFSVCHPYIDFEGNVFLNIVRND